MTRKQLLDSTDWDILQFLEHQGVYGRFVPSREQYLSSRMGGYYDALGKVKDIEDSKLTYRINRLIRNELIRSNTSGNPNCHFIGSRIERRWTLTEKGREVLQRTLVLDKCCGQALFVPMPDAGEAKIHLDSNGSISVNLGDETFTSGSGSLEIAVHTTLSVNVSSGTATILLDKEKFRKEWSKSEVRRWVAGEYGILNKD